jgi:DHA3 family macrolide efflux protein-like MFS transporter
MPAFFVIWTGQAFSLMGSHLVQFALVWYLTSTTGSATVLATATLVAMLPQVFIAPVAGALVDRWNRRAVMIVADSLIALAAAMLAVLFALGSIQVWHIFVMMFLRALGGAFHWPAMQASTSLMVPKEHLSRIAGLNQMLAGAVGIAAPPLAALLMSALPMHGILAIDVGTAILAVGTLLVVSIPQPRREDAALAQRGPLVVLSDMREGLRFVVSWPGLLMIILLATVINLLGTPAFSLLPVFVTDHFRGQALHLAWLETAFGIGIIGGGLLLGVWGGFKRRVVTAMAALCAMGVGLIGMGLLPRNGLYVAIGIMLVIAIVNTIANGCLMALLQAAVPPDKQGRVFTLVLSGATAMAPLGLAAAGPLSDAYGVQVWFIVAGAATLLMGLGAFFVPAIMHVEEQGAALKAKAAAEPVEGVVPAPGDVAAR